MSKITIKTSNAPTSVTRAKVRDVVSGRSTQMPAPRGKECASSPVVIVTQKASTKK